MWRERNQGVRILGLAGGLLCLTDTAVRAENGSAPAQPAVGTDATVVAADDTRKMPRRGRRNVKLPPRDPAAQPAHLVELDKFYAAKGWNIRFPSQADTILKDAGGIRTSLDRYGIGFVEFNTDVYAQNVLPTPLKTPSIFPPSSNRGAIAAGNQVYNGERPTFANSSQLYLTIDLSRLGVPDGQVVVAGGKINATWQPLLPNLFALSNLSYYQTAFDRRVEIEWGIVPNTARFVGSNIGGSFASTFGPAASIHVLLGMAYISAPAFNIKYNFGEGFYSKASVQRSDPVDGPTGNPIYDAAKENPTGLRFSSPQDGVFFVDEIGYRNAAAPGVPQTWVRFGGMYNTSRFRDFTKLIADPTATVQGNGGLYGLGDRQVLQVSSSEAFRGLFVGGTVEYAPARETPITQYYEARLYSVGPISSRPTDLVSFVYDHQVFSPYVAAQLNPIATAEAQAGIFLPMARHASNAYTVSYLAHLAPGIYASGGLGYTDHPSALYFRGEGSALNVLGGIISVF